MENNIENTMENDKNGKRKPVKRKSFEKKAHQGNALPDQRRKTGRGNRDGPACTVRTGLSVVSVHLYEK